MASYSITIELPYHINTVIDQLAEAFTDVDFGDWNYDDEPCTLLGYEDGDYPPNDFFRCDKFYVEIDSRRSVKFEFDDKQQKVYIENDQYKCDYFTTCLANFFPDNYFNERFTICDQYGYERPSQQDDYYGDGDDDDSASLDNYSASLDDNEQLYLFMDHIMELNRIADNEYTLFLKHLSTLNKNKLSNCVSSK